MYCHGFGFSQKAVSTYAENVSSTVFSLQTTDISIIPGAFLSLRVEQFDDVIFR